MTEKDVRDYFREAGYDINQDCTCNDCSEKDTCKFAFDLYNVNGDCLASK